tara:strand:- start:19798 stop:20421 length:624 start_codon:yes stop_codon:yes gene_type:complete
MNLKIFLFAFLYLFYINCCSQQLDSKEKILGEIINDFIEAKYPDESFCDYIYIGIKRQRLYHFQNNELSNIFSVSTAKKGAGNDFSSNQTPTGLHFIKQKIGNNVPVGTLFKNKKSTNKVVEIHKEECVEPKDEITSRILVLSGKEIGINKGSKKDTFSRGIYIHGTSDETSIGYAKSHGCIRMKNNNIITLYNQVNEGMSVVLIDN